MAGASPALLTCPRHVGRNRFAYYTRASRPQRSIVVARKVGRGGVGPCGRHAPCRRLGHGVRQTCLTCPSSCVAPYVCLYYSLYFFSDLFRNYSGTFLAPPAAAPEKEGDYARTPRAPAGAHRPPDGVCVPLHPLLNSYPFSRSFRVRA